MKLDKRINDIGTVLTCFSIEAAKEYLGQQGYFSSDIDHYRDLDLTDFRTLDRVDEDGTPFMSGSLCYPFFLPAEYVRPVEKKWRPFTLEEFRAKFPLLSPVTYRRKCPEKYTRTFCFIGFTASGMIIMGNDFDSLNDLFNDYELKDKDCWTPFGVEE